MFEKYFFSVLTVVFSREWDYRSFYFFKNFYICFCMQCRIFGWLSYRILTKQPTRQEMYYLTGKEPRCINEKEWNPHAQIFSIDSLRQTMAAKLQKEHNCFLLKWRSYRHTFQYFLWLCKSCIKMFRYCLSRVFFLNPNIGICIAISFKIPLGGIF